MIGTRALVTGLAVVALVPLVGPAGPEPSAAIAARQLVLERADAADAALRALEVAIGPGLDAARRGSARVVRGDEAPGSELRRAAAALTSADPAAAAARRAVEALEGARRLVGVGATIGLDVPRGEIGSIAAQVDGAAGAADAFADQRRRAERLMLRLEQALATLEAGSLADARELVAAARDDHDALVAWEAELVTLPVWLETTDAMIGSVERIIAATEAGDGTSASEAAQEFAALAEEAGAADRALRIALGEGGSAVTAAPLGRLADVLREVARTRLEVASIVHAVGR